MIAIEVIAIRHMTEDSLVSLILLVLAIKSNDWLIARALSV